MTINNITGGNSLQSNCQPDQCSAMLTNIHDFITVCKGESVNSHKVTKNPSPVDMEVDELTLYDPQTYCEDLNRIIDFDPEPDISDDELSLPLTNIQSLTHECKNQSICIDPNNVSQNPIEVDEDFNAIIDFDPQFETEDATQSLETKIELISREAISQDSRVICQKLFKNTKCVDCKDNFELMEENAALLSVERVLSGLNKIIPDICFQESLKEKLLNQVKSLQIHFIGCSVHNEEIPQKIKNLSADHVILTFVNDINNILSGKTQTLPEIPSYMQKLAYEQRIKKKRIGKYTDIFSAQS